MNISQEVKTLLILTFPILEKCFKNCEIKNLVYGHSANGGEIPTL